MEIEESSWTAKVIEYRVDESIYSFDASRAICHVCPMSLKFYVIFCVIQFRFTSSELNVPQAIFSIGQAARWVLGFARTALIPHSACRASKFAWDNAASEAGSLRQATNQYGGIPFDLYSMKGCQAERKRRPAPRAGRRTTLLLRRRADSENKPVGFGRFRDDL